MIPLNKIKVDSFRLLVPFTDIEILDSNLESEIVAQVLSTGEIQELEHKQVKTQVFKTIQGIKSRFAIHHLFNENKEHTKYLSIIVSAKMLKESYFEGINKDNIHKVFEFVNSTGVIKINKETFLSAKVVDVDFCIDFLLKNGSIKEFVSIAESLSKPLKKTNVISYAKDKNRGIQFGHRENVGKSYLKKQFLKYYGKMLSLKYDKDNVEFYQTFIEKKLFEPTIFSDQQEYKNPINDSNLLRMETTIKNKDHFLTYKEKINTLKDLLQLDTTKKHSFFIRPQMHYINAFKLIQTAENETLTDRVYYDYLLTKADFLQMEVQDTIPFVVQTLFPYDSNDKNLKQKRHKLKKKLAEIVSQKRAEIIAKNKENNNQLLLEFQSLRLIP